MFCPKLCEANNVCIRVSLAKYQKNIINYIKTISEGRAMEKVIELKDVWVRYGNQTILEE